MLIISTVCLGFLMGESFYGVLLSWRLPGNMYHLPCGELSRGGDHRVHLLHLGVEPPSFRLGLVDGGAQPS